MFNSPVWPVVLLGCHQYGTFPPSHRAPLECPDPDGCRETSRCCLPACPPESGGSVSGTPRGAVVMNRGAQWSLSRGHGWGAAETQTSRRQTPDCRECAFTCQPISGGVVGTQPTPHDVGSWRNKPRSWKEVEELRLQERHHQRPR